MIWERLLVGSTVSVKLAKNLSVKEPLASPSPSGRAGGTGQEPTDVKETGGVGQKMVATKRDRVQTALDRASTPE